MQQNYSIIRKRTDNTNSWKKKSYEKKKICYIYKIGFSTDDDNNNYNEVRDHYQYKRKYRVMII